MPNYAGHATINFSAISAASVYAVTAQNIPTETVGIAASAFVIATLVLSPDLDLYHSSPTKAWGALKLFWLPYSLFSKHRGISHSIVFSTAMRLLYLSSVIVVCFLAFHFMKVYALSSNVEGAIDATKAATDIALPPVSSFIETYREPIILIIGGIFAADVLHIMSDKIYGVFR